MKGGGVKGLAFAGALCELERHYQFDVFVGASAGAIAATLLAAGFTAGELRAILLQKNFAEFLDGSPLLLPWNLLTRQGLHPGEKFQNWLRGLLNQKLPRLDRIPLSALPHRTVLYAADTSLGTLIFDSQGENRDVDADFAVRCSMSIPLLFWPPYHNNRKVLDGGMLNNFPLDSFVRNNPATPILALYLGATRVPEISRSSIVSDILQVWLGRDDLQVANTYRSSTVVIDPSPIRTTDFELSDSEKRFLLARGRAAALDYLEEYGESARPSAADLDSARHDAAEALTAATAAVNRRRTRGRLKVALAASVAALIVFAAVRVGIAVGLGRSVEASAPSTGNYTCQAGGRPMTACRIVESGGPMLLHFEAPTASPGESLVFRGPLTCEAGTCSSVLQRVFGNEAPAAAGKISLSRAANGSWSGEWIENEHVTEFALSPQR